MRDVAVIGVGETEFGELWDRSFRDLGIEAGLKAIQDAKLRSEDIDAVYIGNMSAGKFIDQEHVSALVADYAGLADMHLPTVRVEGGGACGAIALFQARLAIASGMYDIVVVGGAEKMTDVGEVRAAGRLSATADQEWGGGGLCGAGGGWGGEGWRRMACKCGRCTTSSRSPRSWPSKICGSSRRGKAAPPRRTVSRH